MLTPLRDQFVEPSDPIVRVAGSLHDLSAVNRLIEHQLHGLFDGGLVQHAFENRTLVLQRSREVEIRRSTNASRSPDLYDPLRLIQQRHAKPNQQVPFEAVTLRCVEANPDRCPAALVYGPALEGRKAACVAATFTPND